MVAAAVCPHPPLIVPEVAGAAAAELDGLRAACDAALAVLAGSGARRLLVVGAGAVPWRYRPPYRGSFRPWGVPIELTLDGGDGGGDGVADPPLPLSLLVGGWLLRRGFRPPRPVGIRMVSVPPDAPVDSAAGPGDRMDPDGGRGVAGAAGAPADRTTPGTPWALLAMGDGSACRGVGAPGYDDGRARRYDDGVAAALGAADPAALLDLDSVLSTELRVAGRAAWQVMAAAARCTGGEWRGDLLHHAAPYGVAYFVATWRAR
jgi:hypothetical protein